MPIVENHAVCQICKETETKNRSGSGMPVCLSCDIVARSTKEITKDIELKLLKAIREIKTTEKVICDIIVTKEEALFLLEAYRQLEQRVISRRRQEVVKELYKLRDDKTKLAVRILDLEKALEGLKFRGLAEPETKE